MPEAQENPQGQPAAAAAVETSDLQRLLAGEINREFRPQTDSARQQIDAAVTTLAEQALKSTTLISGDALESIKKIIAQIDKRIGDQVNEILHNPDFQKIESAWRGLHYLVNNTESDETLKIRVMNISKKDLQRTLRRFKGAAWDQSPIFKKLYGEEYDLLGGEPYGCLVGDYHFDHTGPDVEMLGEISKIAAAMHAPFITGAAPSLFQMKDWRELSNPRDLTGIFNVPEYAAWRSLRDSEDARYLGLTLPRFLARRPYGAKSNPVDEFDFEEETSGADGSSFSWANSAYAMATNINKSFKMYGWCSRIRGVESGGLIENLPTHTFPTDDGGVGFTCPTEIAIGDRREAELAKNGFMALLHCKNTDKAAFVSAQSLQKPAVFVDADSTQNANLSARLTYLFAACRFAHYLKCIVRDKIGSFKERDEMKSWLQAWITNYVVGEPSQAPDEIKARKPLAAAEVQVEEVEGNPGYYSAKFFLRPHYQLEGLSVTLSLVSRVPSQRTG